jgi:hypothetical protein
VPENGSEKFLSGTPFTPTSWSVRSSNLMLQGIKINRVGRAGIADESVGIGSCMSMVILMPAIPAAMPRPGSKKNYWSFASNSVAASLAARRSKSTLSHG